jgi:3-oxoacyl-[acyl-carrier protein] reductase
MNLDLTGKRALVCGSTQGIGFAAAAQLSKMGCSVTLMARNAAKLEEAVALLDASQEQKHAFIVADFDHPASVEEAISAYVTNEVIHILVNNTGGPPAGAAHLAKAEEFRIAFNQHLICNHILAQHVIPGMRTSGYGRIINVISTSVKQPLPNLGVSNTVRGAVANWAKTLANELGPDQITVNNILPGATDTGRLNSIISGKASKTGQEETAVRKSISDSVPLKRIGLPSEIANAIAFLASPAASYISGVNLPVDGGRTSCL